ncbi:hypothetical protein RsTz2092_09970 [Deferribacterales bacterium RsTz2092]|nr:hypothetical protein AGMMS49941_08900 [Deferribacterales bacterium]
MEKAKTKKALIVIFVIVATLVVGAYIALNYIFAGKVRSFLATNKMTSTVLYDRVFVNVLAGSISFYNLRIIVNRVPITIAKLTLSGAKLASNFPDTATITISNFNIPMQQQLLGAYSVPLAALGYAAATGSAKLDVAYTRANKSVKVNIASIDLPKLGQLSGNVTFQNTPERDWLSFTRNIMQKDISAANVRFVNRGIMTNINNYFARKGNSTPAKAKDRTLRGINKRVMVSVRADEKRTLSQLYRFVETSGGLMIQLNEHSTIAKLLPNMQAVSGPRAGLLWMGRLPVNVIAN